MGLDMYLSKRTYVKNWNHMRDEDKHTITIKRNGKATSVKPNRISEVIEEVAYWRKANHIHQWFVANCQNGVDNCQESIVSFEQLTQLRDALDEVVHNKHKGEELLPTQGGFFFGSTDYDEYYEQENKHTLSALNKLLKEKDADSQDYYYQASW